ncbi:MAG: DUF1648 domain-containing protein [Bryobacterales bacterium]|nr:DUF1648 domain-containing protein [Bryobacterales bacterium]
MRVLWHALAAMATLLPVLWLVAVYPELPEKVPVHWNIHGVPDRWAMKSFASVFLIAALSMEVQLLLGLLVHDSDVARERAAGALRHSLTAMYRMLQPMRFILAALMAVLMLGLRAGEPAEWFSPAMTACTAALIVGTLVGVYRSYVAQSDYEASAPAGAPEFRDENYRWGVIYYNPGDANFLVHKRAGIGFTVNAAHRRAWLYLAVTLLLLATAVGGSLLV